MDGSFFLHMISILFNACSSDILNRAELALNYSKSLHQNLSLMRFVVCLSPKICQIALFVSKKMQNSIFCLQKDTKQCCNAMKLDCTHCAGCLVHLAVSPELSTYLVNIKQRRVGSTLEYATPSEYHICMYAS